VLITLTATIVYIRGGLKKTLNKFSEGGKNKIKKREKEENEMEPHVFCPFVTTSFSSIWNTIRHGPHTHVGSEA